MTINVTEEVEEGILVLRLKGRLDALALPILEKLLQERIDTGKNKILLDFGGIDYLSSAGMRLLLSVTKKLKQIGGKMVVCSIADNVMQIIRLAGFDHILTLHDIEATALRVLSQ
jgi:anti-sigma B factor antagonist/stage II sporulation protein AA (anti-sigma F factor antagonist)